MKKILILSTIIFSSLFSCTKGEESGNLPGYWELLSIERNGITHNVKGEKLFWAERQGLLELFSPPSRMIFSHVKISGNSLEITDFNTPSEYATEGDDSKWISFKERSKLFEWGIWAEQDNSEEKVKSTFHIELLNEDKMILTSDSSRLVFRKF